MRSTVTKIFARSCSSLKGEKAFQAPSRLERKALSEVFRSNYYVAYSFKNGGPVKRMVNGILCVAWVIPLCGYLYFKSKLAGKKA